MGIVFLGLVARLRGQPVEQVRALIARLAEGRVPDLFGEPCVNLLALNLALERETMPAR